MNAVIITIGDELLIGQVTDTNSTYIARELNKAGIKVLRRVAVGDVWEDIWKCLDEESPRAQVVLMTGGLGPTADDITKPLLCEYFGGKMIVDEGALKNVKYLFTEVFKRPLIERNLKQAEVPDVCKVLQNKRGTAPGMLFRKKNCIYISMPGVPHEMKGILEDVIPILVQSFSVTNIEHRTLMTFGIGESFLAEKLVDFEASLPPNIKLSYLPNFGLLRLRLTVSGSYLTPHSIDDYFSRLKKEVEEHMISDRDESIQQLIASLLISEGKTVSTAESCTGGYIAHLLTEIAGSSEYYNGSVVSYSYQAKEDVLEVDPEVLKRSGAVSELIVKQMLKGVVARMKTDYGIAVSGIMGPGGGTPDKPVGTVWIAAGTADDCITQCFHFRYSREINIEVTAQNALNLLRKFIYSRRK